MKLPHLRAKTRSSSGYSFAEVLVASALIGLAIGGAISVSASLNLQNESARTTAAALNLQDCAARLWQLGLSAAECDAIIPQTVNNERLDAALVASGGVNSVLWGTPTTTTLANSMGTLEQVTCSLTLRNPTGGANRTATVNVYRPTLR
jgi:Tfp pilus assembly protein PilV